MPLVIYTLAVLAVAMFLDTWYLWQDVANRHPWRCVGYHPMSKEPKD